MFELKLTYQNLKRANKQWLVVIAPLLSSIATACRVGAIIAFKAILKSLNPEDSQDNEAVSAYIGLILGAQVVSSLVRYIVANNVSAASKVLAENWVDSVNKISVADLRIMAQQGKIDTTATLYSLIHIIPTYISSLYNNFIPNLLQIFAINIYASIVFTMPTIITFWLSSILYTLLSYISAWHLNKVQTETKSEQSYRNENFQIQKIGETLRNHECVVNNDQHDLEKDKAGITITRVANANAKLQNWHTLWDFINNLILAIAQLIVLFSTTGAVLDESDTFDITDLVEIITFYQILSAPLSGIGQAFKIATQYATTVDSIKKAAEHAKEDLNQVALPDEATLAISAVNLSFQYPSTEATIISNLSFELDQAETLAVVGPTSIGKSTFAKLLLGHFTPTNGSIFLGAFDTRHASKSFLRNAIAFIPQAAELYTTETLTYNVNYAEARRKSYDTTKIATAASNAAIAQVGLTAYNNDTPLSQQGLSGGAKKRVEIARAIRKEAKIHIYDEPLAGLDGATAGEVLHQLNQASTLKTRIIITHRISLALGADKILFLYKDANGQNQHVFGTPAELQQNEAFNALQLAESDQTLRNGLRR